jgi:hypothetical protein
MKEENVVDKPNIKDWRNLPTEQWSVTTFRQFLADQHFERYGIAYTARNYAIEARWLKLMIAEHGPEVVREFIFCCMKEYKPTAQYPGINFGFMYSYMRPRVLPRVLNATKLNKVSRSSNDGTSEDIDNWL